MSECKGQLEFLEKVSGVGFYTLGLCAKGRLCREVSFRWSFTPDWSSCPDQRPRNSGLRCSRKQGTKLALAERCSEARRRTMGRVRAGLDLVFASNRVLGWGSVYGAAQETFGTQSHAVRGTGPSTSDKP